MRHILDRAGRLIMLFSIRILDFNDYEKKTVKIKQLLCHVCVSRMLSFYLVLEIQCTLPNFASLAIFLLDLATYETLKCSEVLMAANV